MDLKLEKEKIKRALVKVDDVRIIFGISGYIDQYDSKDKMGWNYIPQRARKIDIAKEKEKIVKAVEAAKGKGLLGGLKWFVLLYDAKDTYDDLKTAPIASWEMSMPFGRKITRRQFEEHLRRAIEDDGPGYTMEEVKEHIKKHSEERKEFWDAI